MKKHEQPKLHILHVATALSWRGGEQQAAYLMAELEQQAVSQTVLCSAGSEMETYCRTNRISFIAVKKTSSLSLSFSKTLRDLCRQLQINLCHLHDAHAHTFAIIAAVVFNNKTPLVLSRRVDFPIKNSWFSKFKYNHPAIKRIVCVSKKIEEITAVGIKNKSLLTTIHSGIDLSKFSHSRILQSELGTEKVLVGNTSALADHKDYFTFVHTAEVVHRSHPEVLFLIFGTGPLEAEISAYIAKKNLNEVVLLMGFRTDIPKILGELDVFLMTSKTEGLGTSILDAFAAGVPVVATNAGGIPELVEHEKTGLLCSVKDAACLAGGVVKLLEDHSLGKRIAENAAAKVRLFSKENTAAKTLALYYNVLESQEGKH